MPCTPPRPVPLLAVCLLSLSCAATTRTGPTAAPTTEPTADALLRSAAAVLRAEDRRRVDPQLLAAADHPAAQIRARAATALGRIGDAAQLSRLESLLADAQPGVRAAAAFALGLLGERSALGVLAERAGDPDPAVRAAVADGLGLFADPAGADELAALLDDEDRAVRTAACFAVARLENGSFAVDALLGLARSRDDEVMFAAHYALAQLASRVGRLDPVSRRRVRARMIELTRAAPSELRRLAAIGLSVPTGEEEAVAVGGLVEDPAPTVRIAAIDALSFPGAPVEPFLTKVLRDPDDRVRLAVVEGLGRMRGYDVVEALSDIVVFDQRLWLREQAVYALARVGRLAAPAAKGLSRSDEPELRRATAALLVNRIDAEFEPIARQLYADEDPRVRAAAIPLLAEIDAPLAELIADVGDGGDPATRRALAAAAGRRLELFGAQPQRVDEALALLERLWQEVAGPPDADLRLAVLDALGSAAAHPTVRRLAEGGLGSADRRQRRAAVELLRRVYDEDRADAAGPAAERPLADYVEILRWSERSHAAVVTVERPGFVPARFTLALDAREAPLAARNFARLAETGFYDGLTIHRRVPNSVVQDGDPRGDGSGGPGYEIRDELRPARFWPGTLGMAASGPDRAGSQWFVTLKAQPQRMERNTAFGRVVQNFEGVVALLLPGDRVVSVRIYEGDGAEPLPPLEPGG